MRKITFQFIFHSPNSSVLANGMWLLVKFLFTFGIIITHALYCSKCILYYSCWLRSIPFYWLPLLKRPLRIYNPSDPRLWQVHCTNKRRAWETFPLLQSIDFTKAQNSWRIEENKMWFPFSSIFFSKSYFRSSINKR